MAFTPNMPQSQVSEMDRRRGHGDSGTYTNPDRVDTKRPWLRIDGTHKSVDENIPGGLASGKTPSDFNKKKLDDGIKVEMEHTTSRDVAREIAMDHLTEDSDYYEKLKEIERAIKDDEMDLYKPVPPKREDETDFERRIRHHMSHLDKHPGGKDQAIAIAAQEAGVSKEPTEKAMTNTKQAIQLLQKSFKKNDEDLPEKMEELLEHELEHHGKIPSKAEEEAEHKDEKTAKALSLLKALSSRSGLRPTRPYDPNASFASATKVPVNAGEAREPSPQGRVPLDVYESCVVHGLIHKSGAGCHLCNVQKAMMCKACGEPLQKVKGGEYACPSHS